MAKITELKKYLTHEFSSGSYTGDDYKTFQTKYINYLKAICRENHWQLVNVGKNHYCFSAFIKSAENKCIYVSISDVRYFTNEWYGHILIRTAKDEQDYRGGFNNYTTLENLPASRSKYREVGRNCHKNRCLSRIRRVVILWDKMPLSNALAMSLQTAQRGGISPPRCLLFICPLLAFNKRETRFYSLLCCLLISSIM